MAGTLKDIRTLFVKRTGRYDLVVNTTDWADNGADAYILAGSKMLDRREEHEFSKAKHYEDGAADTWHCDCGDDADNDDNDDQLDKREALISTDAVAVPHDTGSTLPSRASASVGSGLCLPGLE